MSDIRSFAHAGLTAPGLDTQDIQNTLPEYTSPTAHACDHAALYGSTPAYDEIDNRFVWDRDDALAAMSEAIRIIAHGVTTNGTQLADEREPVLWGFVNMLHAQASRLDRAVDKITPQMRDLEQSQDGTEINAAELEHLTDKARNLGDRRDAFETLRDFAANAYYVEVGNTWRPRYGSHVSQTSALTSAAIDARDFTRARNERQSRAHLPNGTLVAFAGGKQFADTNAVYQELDRARAKYSDMVLLHGGGPGAERIAATWAEHNGVDQVICKPDWNAHGKAAPFRRNDELLKLVPKGLIAFPGSGITANLIDKARQLGIPVHRVDA